MQFWLKNLYLSKQYATWRLLSELPDKGRKLGSVDSLLNRSHKTGTIVRQLGSERQTVFGAYRPCAESGGQARKTSISSRDFAWNCHSPYICAQDNSPWSPAQMLQMTSCSAVVWSQLHLPSHYLINNLIICNKSCYCSIINRKLNIKQVK